MPWWSTLLICLFLSIIFIIVLLIVIKNGKKLNAKTKIGNKSFDISVENDNDLSINPQKLHNYISNMPEDFFNHYVTVLMDSHFLFQSGFSIIENKTEIIYRILIKLLKKKEDIDLKDLNINLCLLHNFIQKYLDNFKIELIELFGTDIKSNTTDLSKIDKFIDDFINNIETNKLLENTILQIKSSNTTLKLMNGEEIDITESSTKYYNKLFNTIEKRFKQLMPELVSEMKMAKSRMIYSENMQIRSLSLVLTTYSLFNAIMKYIVNIFFECKPAIVGDLEGV